jgi:type IV secretory pathway TraG/TraD family ATPase VirD4
VLQPPPPPRCRSSPSSGEHLHGRPLLTPDEIMRLGREQTILLVAGEPPHPLDRINYLIDKAYAGRFDPNPFHALRSAD